jgi:ABC-type uncharacterized transport system involved in gliding motility auxiliary subunit
MMELNPLRRMSLLVQHWLFVVLLLTLVALLAYFAGEHRREWDVTRSGRHTLSPATLEVLGKLPGPLTVTAYARRRDASGNDLQKVITERLRPYLRAKADVTLVIVDPREEPKKAAAAGLRTPNELVVEYRQRSERLAIEAFNEQNFANLLMRLARGSESMVMWIDGHGERKLNGGANHDLGDFGRLLEQRGFRLASLNLSVAQEVPRNVSVLVITAPQVDLLEVEVAKIGRYLESGGNLLWLIDQEPLRGLEPVAETLGLVLTPGTVVDFVLKPRTGAPVFAVGAAANYGRHPVTQGFGVNTVFPHVRQLGVQERAAWRATPLVEVAQGGWVELGKLEAEVTFDKSRDIPGPVAVAYAFERSVEDRSQRVVVVGTGHFLSNTYLGNGGNLELGLNMMNWLAGADHLVAIQPRPAADAQLALEPRILYLIAAAFLLVLPLAFIVGGLLVWWRRRRIT